MTYKVYAIGGLSIIALLVALAYNPVDFTENEIKEFAGEELRNNDQYIISVYQTSAQWEWIKGQVSNAEESEDIESLQNKLSALEKRINTQSSNINSLTNQVKLLDTKTTVAATSTSNEIVEFYTSDGDRAEDRFDQGDTVYFYATIDSNANTLYYEIINDDTNDEVKDRRLEVRDNTQLAWAWTIPSTQADGDYYIEIDIGNANERVYFEIR
jgi:hypothetical protein